jgi:hypothetical protein
VKALKPTDLKWKRERGSWAAHAPEGAYWIEGRSGRYNVVYRGDNLHAVALLATDIAYLDYAKMFAEEDHAKRTATGAYTSAAFKKIVAAQEQLRLAIGAAQRDGLEEVEGILLAANEPLYAIRQDVLRAGKVSQHDPREQAEDVKLGARA